MGLMVRMRCALRWRDAGQGRNIKLSVDRVQAYRNFGTKLWNAARFAQMNGCRRAGVFDPMRSKRRA